MELRHRPPQSGEVVEHRMADDQVEGRVGEAGLRQDVAEIAGLRASQINGCGACVHGHTDNLRTAGVSEAGSPGVCSASIMVERGDIAAGFAILLLPYSLVGPFAGVWLTCVSPTTPCPPRSDAGA